MVKNKSIRTRASLFTFLNVTVSRSVSLVILIGFSCSFISEHPQNTSGNPNTDKSTLKDDSVEEIQTRLSERELASVVQLTEAAFWKNVRQIDAEQGRNYSGSLRKIFSNAHKTPFDLYTNIVAINKQAKQDAIQKAVSLGYKERNYTYYINDIRAVGISKLMNKYRLTHNLLTVFHNNFCFCYSGKIAKYCLDGVCRLPDGEIW